jgi:hypothetical protein
VVRQQVGYARYDTVEALEILRELYVHLRLYVNFFQPQTQLIEKIRRGAIGVPPLRPRHGPLTNGSSAPQAWIDGSRTNSPGV